MLNMDEQFLRSKLILGDDNLLKLKNSKVTIVGLGAVGGYVLEALARVGVHNFTLIDFDTISETNINRQILALHSTIGNNKCDEAKKRVLDINPNANVTIYKTFFSKNDSLDLLNEDVDIIIDAIDSITAKSKLISECYKRNIPTFSSMGAALRKDWTKIKVGYIFEVKGCSLARHLKKLLKKDGLNVNCKIKCVYSNEEIEKNRIGDWSKVDIGEERKINRRELGSLPTITGMFGLIIANEVISFLIDKKF